MTTHPDRTITCRNCGRPNRVPSFQAAGTHRCGYCGILLPAPRWTHGLTDRFESWSAREIEGIGVVLVRRRGWRRLLPHRWWRWLVYDCGELAYSGRAWTLKGASRGAGRGVSAILTWRGDHPLQQWPAPIE